MLTRIIGANSGVGYAAATVIAGASQAYHVIVAGRSQEKIEKAKSEIEASGVKGELSTVQLDVTDQDSITQAASYVNQKFGRLDVLINNAGVSPADFRTCAEVNVTGPTLVSAAFRELLLKAPAPYSVYVSSVVGSLALASDPTSPLYGDGGTNAYRASKAALNFMVIQDWKNSKETPLKVFAMCPGYVVSNLRGTSDEARSGYGKAGDPLVSGNTILSIIEGKRDADVGRLVHKDGVYPW